MDTRKDEVLMEAHNAGDAEAFPTLVARYLAPLYNFVSLYIRNEGDAEDITQDVFVSAWKSAKSFDHSKRFKTWLFAIAKNAAFNWLKRKKPLAFADLASDESGGAIVESIIDDAPLPEELFERKDIAETLNRTLRTLSPLYQSVIVLHHKEELTFKEIAELGGESVDTVKSRYRRALQLLRKTLVK